MKTNNQADRQKVKNPTTNYPMDSHKHFCKRCIKINGRCPITGNKPSTKCEI